MAYIQVLQASELQPGEKVKVEVEGTNLLLANIDGSFYAINNRCPHLGNDLSKGDLVGGSIKCPHHHAEFDLKTGKNLSGAKLAFLTIKVKDAKTYPVTIEDGNVFVDLEA